MREALCAKLDSFNIPESDDRKFFRNKPMFVFESICVQADESRHIKTTKWISKHVPLTVSISSNLIEQTTFLCNSDTGALVDYFVDTLDELATQSTVQMTATFLENETSLKSNLNPIFSTHNQCRCRKYPVLEFEDGCIKEEEHKLEVMTQILQSQKNQLIESQDHLKIYCNVL